MSVHNESSEKNTYFKVSLFPKKKKSKYIKRALGHTKNQSNCL